jgi:hypothetical protein
VGAVGGSLVLCGVLLRYRRGWRSVGLRIHRRWRCGIRNWRHGVLVDRVVGVELLFSRLLVWGREIPVACGLRALILHRCGALHLLWWRRWLLIGSLRPVGLHVGNNLSVGGDLLLLLLFLHAHEDTNGDEEEDGEDCDNDADDGADGELLGYLVVGCIITASCGNVHGACSGSRKACTGCAAHGVFCGLTDSVDSVCGSVIAAIVGDAIRRIGPCHTVRTCDVGALPDQSIENAVGTTITTNIILVVDASTGPAAILCVAAPTASSHTKGSALVKHTSPSYATSYW